MINQEKCDSFQQQQQQSYDNAKYCVCQIKEYVIVIFSYKHKDI